MFMRNNRAKNGAPQPEDVAAQDAPEQSSQQMLMPNLPVGNPEGTRTFDVEPYASIEEINRRHYRGGLDEAEWPDYEEKVPVGPKMP